MEGGNQHFPCEIPRIFIQFSHLAFFRGSIFRSWFGHPLYLAGRKDTASLSMPLVLLQAKDMNFDVSFVGHPRLAVI